MPLKEPNHRRNTLRTATPAADSWRKGGSTPRAPRTIEVTTPPYCAIVTFKKFCKRCSSAAPSMLGFTISSPRPKFLPGAARRGERNILLRRKTEPLKNVPKWRRRRSLAKNEDFLSKGSPEPPPKIKGSEKVFSFFLRNKNAKDYIEVFFYRHGGGRTSCFKYRKAVSYYEHGH